MLAETLDTPELSINEENAYALSEAAIFLDQARQRREDANAMAAALRHNVELWIAIQSLVKRINGALPDEVKANLLKLGDYVVGTTLRDGPAIGEHTLDTLININLQISEGLLEADVN